MPPSAVVWPVTESHPPVDWMDFEAVADRDWQHWRAAFLSKFTQLAERRRLSAEVIPQPG